MKFVLRVLRAGLGMVFLGAAIGKTLGVLDGDVPSAAHLLAGGIEFGLGVWLVVSTQDRRPIWFAIVFLGAAAVRSAYLVARGEPTTSLCGCFGPRVRIELLQGLILTGFLLGASGVLIACGSSSSEDRETAK